MKSYRVYELNNHRFTWAGCTVINVNHLCSDGLVISSDRIEFYEVLTDREVMGLCLDWLENNDFIDEAAAYLL